MCNTDLTLWAHESHYPSPLPSACCLQGLIMLAPSKTAACCNESNTGNYVGMKGSMAYWRKTGILMDAGVDG